MSVVSALLLLSFVLCMQSHMVHAAAYLGCFAKVHLAFPTRPGAALRLSRVNDCSRACMRLNHALFAIAQRQQQCWCGSILSAARPVVDQVCASSRAQGHVAVYYIIAAPACRTQQIPLLPNTTEIAYNPHRVEFAADGSQVRVNMTGDGAGTRLAIAQSDYKYGLYQVTAQIDSTPGVVSAFYLRSDYWQETQDFSEIDYEFLNDKPSTTPNGLWLNSFAQGQSSGERLVVPAQYQKLLNLTSKQHAGNQWLTYGINWLPDRVTWILNGIPVQSKLHGEVYRWTDMLGTTKQRTFKVPNKPSHVTFSIWTATGTGLGFGGRIDPSLHSSMFSSEFRHHRRIVCGKPQPR